MQAKRICTSLWMFECADAWSDLCQVTNYSVKYVPVRKKTPSLSANLQSFWSLKNSSRHKKPEVLKCSNMQLGFNSEGSLTLKLKKGKSWSNMGSSSAACNVRSCLKKLHLICIDRFHSRLALANTLKSDTENPWIRIESSRSLRASYIIE